MPRAGYTVITSGVFLGLIFVIWTWRSFSSGSVPSHLTYSSLLSISEARQKSLQPIANSTLGFEKILAVSLPERTDHRDGLVLAAAVSNLDVDFIDGIRGETVTPKVFPPNYVDNLSPGTLGAWRAHMNAISQVVKNGWSTALIVEDDLDWDVRLREQLQNFALGSEFVLQNFYEDIEVSASNLKHSRIPTTSLYGDNWDVLWLGHCGAGITEHTRSMMFENDDTVPVNDKIGSFNDQEQIFMQQYPQHTRVVTRSYENTCSLAYAVSQRGARALLHELGLQKLSGPFDNMLRDFCEGNNGRGDHQCVAVLPPIFDHHRRAISPAFDSDISSEDGSVRERAYTLNVRWSVRLNMEKILRGETDYEDQWPGE